MIYYIGGIIETNDFLVTHYIVSKENYIKLKNKASKNEAINRMVYKLNMKWIIDSYFFIKRVDEKDYTDCLF